jgi:hypothetical protein
VFRSLRAQEFNRLGVSEVSCSGGQEWLRPAVQEAKSSWGQLFRRTGVLRPAVQEARSSWGQLFRGAGVPEASCSAGQEFLRRWLFFKSGGQTEIFPEVGWWQLSGKIFFRYQECSKGWKMMNKGKIFKISGFGYRKGTIP